MPVLKTLLCDLLDIEYPICAAGMGSNFGSLKAVAATGPDLAAAVSNAGGLGVLSCTMLTADEIEEAVVKTRALTRKPFGANVVFPSGAKEEQATVAELEAQIPKEYIAFRDRVMAELGVPQPKELHLKIAERFSRINARARRRQLETIIELRVPVFVSGLGSPDAVLSQMRQKGMKVMSLVGSSRAARNLAALGVDAIIATGYEAGGHSGGLGAMVLIPEVARAIHPTPLVAGGGIVTGRQMAAALVLGACGVWCGTAFLATREAAIDDWWKEMIVRKRGEDTIQSRYWTGKTLRSFRSLWEKSWEKSGLEPLPMNLHTVLSAQMSAGAVESGKYEFSGARTGQGISMIEQVKPAAQVVADMVHEAVHTLATLNQRVKYS